MDTIATPYAEWMDTRIDPAYPYSVAVPDPAHQAKVKRVLGWLRPVQADAYTMYASGIPQTRISTILGMAQPSISLLVSTAIMRMGVLVSLPDLSIPDLRLGLAAEIAKIEGGTYRWEPIATSYCLCASSSLSARHLGRPQQSVSDIISRLVPLISQDTPAGVYLHTIYRRRRDLHGSVVNGDEWTGYARGPFQQYWSPKRRVVA